MRSKNDIVDRAVAAAFTSLLQHPDHREMGCEHARGSQLENVAVAVALLRRLQRAFATPVARIQQLCLKCAFRDLQLGAPGNTLFVVATQMRDGGG